METYTFTILMATRQYGCLDNVFYETFVDRDVKIWTRSNFFFSFDTPAIKKGSSDEFRMSLPFFLLKFLFLAAFFS